MHQNRKRVHEGADDVSSTFVVSGRAEGVGVGLGVAIALGSGFVEAFATGLGEALLKVDCAKGYPDTSVYHPPSLVTVATVLFS